MDRERKIYWFIRRDVLGFLIGFGAALVLVDSFHLGGWLDGEGSQVFHWIILACLIVMAIIEIRLRRRKVKL